MQMQCKPSAIKLVWIAEVPLALCKCNANRVQSNLFGIAEMPLALCKCNANRVQSNLFGIAEVPLIFYKYTTYLSESISLCRYFCERLRIIVIN